MYTATLWRITLLWFSMPYSSPYGSLAASHPHPARTRLPTLHRDPPQMALWIFYELPWTLAAGGAVVGYLTNWIALKLIFEPVEPTQMSGLATLDVASGGQHSVMLCMQAEQ